MFLVKSSSLSDVLYSLSLWWWSVATELGVNLHFLFTNTPSASEWGNKIKDTNIDIEHWTDILTIMLLVSVETIVCLLPAGGTSWGPTETRRLSVSSPWRIPWFQTDRINHGEFGDLKCGKYGKFGHSILYFISNNAASRPQHTGYIILSWEKKNVNFQLSLPPLSN